MDEYKQTGLWARSLGIDSAKENDEAYALLKSNYTIFRERAGALTSQIAKALPNLTIHDVTHLDALWETADLIAGNDYPLNPAEAFVLGGAILLHDAALCFEAYQGGQEGLRSSTEWKDAFAVIERRAKTASAAERLDEADFAAMRLLHAEQAGELALRNWVTPEGDQLYLIESYELRKHYGKLIGDIASSHHWSIEDVGSKLPPQLNAPAGLPREWRVDPVKVACLLRCADAAHLDGRRAPDFLRSLAAHHGVSALHWTAQNWLERVDRDTAATDQDALLFTSGRQFDEENAEAWWVAFDAMQLVDRELSASNALLESRPQADISPPFQMRRVTGARSPQIASRTVKTEGWTPEAVEIHVGNLERLISELGGEKLYGSEQSLLIVLRELLQNARDAIVARRALDTSYVGKIRIRHAAEDSIHVLTIEDDGVGMSERVLTGPLLDFGASFWASDLARYEFPGLMSQGYRSVGKYGIGFYSVFMAANSVAVSSRRFDRGHDTVMQVKFPRGLSLRPVVASGPPPTFEYSTSTRVELTLKAELESPEQIVVHKGRPGYEPEVRLSLAQCLAILSAGLDVHVELTDRHSNSSIVHRPLSELDSPDDRRAWLFGFAAPAGQSPEIEKILESHAQRLRPIVLNGQTLGMAALSTARLSVHQAFGTVQTVGGLANAIPRSNLSRFIGVMDHESESAKREPTAQVSAGKDVLQAWAMEQITFLPDRRSDPFVWCMATCSLADLEIDPIEFAMMLIQEESTAYFCDLDALIDIIVSKGLAIYESPNLPHMETHHALGGYLHWPTFRPIENSAFLSLDRDEDGKPRINSAISCIERRAEARGIEILRSYAGDKPASLFGPMPVLLLNGREKA